MRKDNMRTFIIGDVHGCYDELRSLFQTLNPRAEDQFVFLGDLVDKGRDTIKVLRYVRMLLQFYPGSACIAGNHESKALERLRQGKLETKGEVWTREASEADWAFIKSMPLYHRVPGLNAIAVHGGFFPRFFNLYPQGLDDEKLLVDNWQRKSNKYVSRARRFQYIRYINEETGGQLPLNEETEDTPHWGKLYDGREGFAFYGHQPNYEGNVQVWDHAVGVDTACVAGMFLTAAVLTHRDEGKYDLDYAQVAATEATIENARRHQVKRDAEKGEKHG